MKPPVIVHTADLVCLPSATTRTIQVGVHPADHPDRRHRGRPVKKLLRAGSSLPLTEEEAAHVRAQLAAGHLPPRDYRLQPRQAPARRRLAPAPPSPPLLSGHGGEEGAAAAVSVEIEE